MNHRRRTLVLALTLSPLLARAQQQGFQFSEVKPPQPVESDGKIEVIEFFSYDCIHCYNLEPYLEKWEAKLPRDVSFRRVPATFQAIWPMYAAVFYTFEMLGILPKVHRPFFDARHRDRLMLELGQPVEKQEALAAWLQKQGIDTKRFFDMMKSFGIQSRVRRASQQTAAYKVEGTPTMAVHGSYTVSTEEGRTREGMLQTVDYLVGVVRKKK